ncbi:hypothetical protein MAM1_0038c02757 [Mucor ambiguus]|uniref:START domain-containing protein n=1 Tax=Mucor ambiguus TaxID=91626 RepID=A0A0C9M8A6_9FUNG|nr:hypothetical protein MAM1_0038c02757 [Mucor ambiguus]
MLEMRRKPSLPIPPAHSQQDRMNKKFYLDRDSGIVTETDSEIEYSNTTKRNYIFSDDEEVPTVTNTLTSQHNFYSHLADQAVMSVRHYLKDDSWKKVLKHKSGTTVYMMQQTNKNEKVALFRGESIIQGFTPQSIFYVIGMRKLWDEQFEDGKLIENLNDTSSLTYESYKSTATSKAYDYTLVEKIECSADGEILFACTSVETPQVPKSPGKNRHQIKVRSRGYIKCMTQQTFNDFWHQLQGWVLKQLNTFPVSTHVTYLTQENIKGWIPGLTKKSLARKPLIIASIDSYLQKKAERIRVQQQQPQPKKSIPITIPTTNTNASSSISLPQTTTTSTSSFASPPTSILLQRPSAVSAPNLFEDQTSPTLGLFSTTSTSLLLDTNSSKKLNNIILSNPPPRISSLSTQTNSTISTQQAKRITFADQVDLSSRSSSPSNTFSSSSARSSSASSSSDTGATTPYQQQTQDDSLFDNHSQVPTLFPLPPSTSTVSHQLSPIQEVPMPFSSKAKSSSIAIAGTKLYPASRHRTARKQCIEKLQTYAHSDLKEWKHIGEKNNTQLYTQAVEGSSLPVMRSETAFVGSWTPEQICSVIQCFGARKEWDEHFEKGEIIERFSQKEYLIHTQMKSLFPIQSRDFCILTCIESAVATGAIYIGSVSVEDELIPENTQHIRGKLNAYGWALKPITRGKDGQWMGVQVTFIAHMNMGGSGTTPLPLPSAIVRLLTTQACADSIQTYLAVHGCPPYIRRVAGKIIYEEFNVRTNQYTIRYIAKHAPSPRRHHQQQQQQQKQKMIGSMWCTDVRTHQSMYPLGYSIETHQDVRVDVRPNIGLRIYTEKDELDGETVELVISKHTTGSEPQFYCNGIEVCAVVKGAKNQGVAKNELADHTPSVSEATPSRKLSSTAATAATTFRAASVAKQREELQEEEKQVEGTNDKVCV